MSAVTTAESSPRDRRWVWLAVLVPLAVALDQVTKLLAEDALSSRTLPLAVIDGFFMLHYSRNAGAFFNLGENLPGSIRVLFFAVVTLAAIAFLVILYRRSAPQAKVLRAALLLLVAGAIGNLTDRLIRGEVIDFLHLHYRDVFHWATFNVADIYITAGVVLLLWDSFRREKPSSRTAEAT